MPIVSFLLYVFVTSFTPGPNNIMSMLFGNKFGLKKTSRFCFGVGTGFFIIMILSSYFNLLLKNLIPQIEFFMTMIGAAYMCYLAWKILMSKKMDTDDARYKYNGFTAGMLLQFINPKGIIYGITVVSTFIIPYYTANTMLIIFSIFLAFVGFLSTSSWSMCGSIFQRFLSKYRKPFNVVMALLLVYSAVSIVVE